MSEQQRLDSMSKILLATSTINYMANTVNGVVADYEKIDLMNSVPESAIVELSKKVVSDSLQQKRDFMIQMSKKLSEIVEEFADYINGCGMVCEIDERINRVPCEILLLGKDLVETNYDADDAPFA